MWCWVLESSSNGHKTEDDYLSLTRLILLAADAAFLTRAEEPTVGSILQPVVEVLMTMNSHAYMSVDKAEHAIVIIMLLAKESRPLTGIGLNVGSDELMSVFHWAYNVGASSKQKRLTLVVSTNNITLSFIYIQIGQFTVDNKLLDQFYQNSIKSVASWLYSKFI